MSFKKNAFPEENEIVVCTVTKIQFHSVFATVDEYNKSGMIHISEISPGRIRNIRDYVKEGKVVVCKVLKINRERGYIDLSLRRVNENQRREKINSIKQEQKAEKIIEYVAENHKLKAADLRDQILSVIKESYESIYPFFEDVVSGEAKLSNLKLTKVIEKDLDETIRQRIKPPEVSISGTLSVQSYAPEGLKIIQEGFKTIEGKEDLTIRFLGGGRFHLSVIAPDYKDAEKKLKDATDTITNFFKKKECEASFERIEKK